MSAWLAKSKEYVFIYVLVSLLFFSAQDLLAANNGNMGNYAWAEQFGYISLSGAGASVDYGVTVANETLTGYAWSELTGWIKFSGSLYTSYNNGRGLLAGYAWSELLGYISLADASGNNYYQVSIAQNGILSGYAWSETAGYINFNDAGSYYSATTTWTYTLPQIAPVIFQKGTILKNGLIIK